MTFLIYPTISSIYILLNYTWYSIRYSHCCTDDIEKLDLCHLPLILWAKTEKGRSIFSPPWGLRENPKMPRGPHTNEAHPASHLRKWIDFTPQFSLFRHNITTITEVQQNESVLDISDTFCRYMEPSFSFRQTRRADNFTNPLLCPSLSESKPARGRVMPSCIVTLRAKFHIKEKKRGENSKGQMCSYTGSR